MARRYPRYKTFDLTAAAERAPAQPTLQSLAYELAALVGTEAQRAFSASLDWTQPTHVLRQRYQDKIAAERQLVIDNQPCAYIDAWLDDQPATEADDLAALAQAGYDPDWEAFERETRATHESVRPY